MTTATDIENGTEVLAHLKGDLDAVDARILETVDIGIPKVSGLVQSVVKTSGKRLRPSLLLLVARSFEPDGRALISAAAGVELLHTASLVHDDDIDHAALRRGRPTLSTQVNSVTAILIGDFLFAQSAILAAATDSTRVVSVFASTLGNLCQGQIREMLESHAIDQSLEQYETRIYGKTASLFAGAAEMGAIIGGATEHQITEIRAFGRDLGMAFQIVDDILDVAGESGTIGKPAGNDLRQGTVTLPVMHYVAGLAPDSSERARLEGVVSGDLTEDTVIAGVIADIRASGALESAMDVARDYITCAIERLDVIPDPTYRARLAQIARLVVERNA
ncbi:MAG TPA: polyprenyl synthetase family protein [Thermomicrobiales bacterium]|jgi:geranylgeranyl pyrophosphate synthase|nr:polyprenyl synthetase family protein [Thermomicrobiales bacterium]